MPRRRATTFGIGVLGGALLIAFAAVYAVRTYPEAVSRWQTVPLFFALFVYLAFGLWSGSSRAVQAESSLAIGAAVGVVLGILGAVNLTIENFVILPGSLGAIVPATAMAAMVIAFAVAASLAIRRSGSIALALLASVWCAVVGMVLTCAYGFVINLAAIDRLSAGVRDARATVVENTFASASMHMLIAPVVAGSVASVAIVATLISRSVSRRAVVVLALIEFVQLILGIVALVFAASLQRAQRPPFVMSGMLATALALACFPALALNRGTRRV